MWTQETKRSTARRIAARREKNRSNQRLTADNQTRRMNSNETKWQQQQQNVNTTWMQSSHALQLNGEMRLSASSGLAGFQERRGGVKRFTDLWTNSRDSSSTRLPYEIRVLHTSMRLFALVLRTNGEILQLRLVASMVFFCTSIRQSRKWGEHRMKPMN